MKHVVIVNHNAGAPPYGPNYRSYYVARSLVARGYRVSIVASSFSHKLHTLPAIDGRVTHEGIDGVDYYWLRGRPFRGRIGRMVEYRAFARKLRGLAQIVPHRPDIVICSSPPPLWVWNCHRYARQCGAKLIFEARDLWPQVVLDTVRFARLNPLTHLIAAAERFAYRRADAVVSVSPASQSYMADRGLPAGRFRCIPNGLDLSQLEAADETAQRDSPDAPFRLGYLGALGKSYGLPYLIDAAKLLADEDVSVVLVGDGPMKGRLQRRAQGLPNVRFVDRVPKAQVPAALAGFDAGYAGFLDRPAFRYGGNQNKLYDYMAAAKPVICALRSDYNPVASADCGLTVAPESAKAIAEAARQMRDAGTAERQRLGQNGRRYLEQYHSYERLGELWTELIESLSIRTSTPIGACGDTPTSRDAPTLPPQRAKAA